MAFIGPVQWSHVRKALVAVATVLSQVVAFGLVDGDTAKVVGLVIGVLGAYGVYAVPNVPATALDRPGVVHR